MMLGFKKKKTRYVSTKNARAYLDLKKERERMTEIFTMLSPANLRSFSLAIVDRKDIGGPGSIGYSIDLEDDDPWAHRPMAPQSSTDHGMRARPREVVPFREELRAFLADHYQKRIDQIDHKIAALEQEGA